MLRLAFRRKHYSLRNCESISILPLPGTLEFRMRICFRKSVSKRFPSRAGVPIKRLRHPPISAFSFVTTVPAGLFNPSVRPFTSFLGKMADNGGASLDSDGSLQLFGDSSVAIPTSWKGLNAVRHEIGSIQENSKVTVVEGPADFNPGKYYTQCLPKDQKYGKVIIYGHKMPSTQDFIKTQCSELPEGTVCIADFQTKGRGRGENVWTSPPGCLMFTLKSTVKEGRLLPLVQYVASLAIVEGINSFPSLGSTDVKIKWPNDIYVNKSIKIGGILCESVFVRGVAMISIGIGINLDNDEPTTCLNSLREKESLRISKEELLSRILTRYEKLLAELIDPSCGFARIKAEYEKNWLHSGQQVTLESYNNLKATINGISSTTGSLLATCDSTGEKLELLPDGNRMDFFQGLLTRKLS